MSLSAPRAKFDVEVRVEALQLLGKAGEVFFLRIIVSLVIYDSFVYYTW